MLGDGVEGTGGGGSVPQLHRVVVAAARQILPVGGPRQPAYFLDNRRVGIIDHILIWGFPLRLVRIFSFR